MITSKIKGYDKSKKNSLETLSFIRDQWGA